MECFFYTKLVYIYSSKYKITPPKVFLHQDGVKSLSPFLLQIGVNLLFKVYNYTTKVFLHQDNV